MKKTILLFSVISLLLIGCTVNKEPEYIKTENFKVTKLGLKNIQIKADAIFENPNSLGITIKKTDIDVYKDSIYLGKAIAPSFEVNKESQFTIPLTIDFSPKKLVKQKGLLGGALGVLSKKSIELTYKGTITLTAVGIDYDYDFEEKQTLDLKK